MLDGVEEKQVRSAIVMILCELTLMDSSAGSQNTQKCYQRYLEPQTLRRGTTYKKFASDLHREFHETVGQQRLGCGVHSLLSVSFFLCSVLSCVALAFAFA